MCVLNVSHKRKRNSITYPEKTNIFSNKIGNEKTAYNVDRGRDFISVDLIPQSLKDILEN